VFDKESRHILGYSDTGDINEKFRSFEAEFKGKVNKEEVATHMLLVVYVCGIFMKLEYPLAHTCILNIWHDLSYKYITAASCHDFYDIVWDAVSCLMGIGLYLTVVV
jgi:hypothetical protein